MKKKRLIKIFTVLALSISLFALLVSSAFAFTFNSDLGSPSFPMVSQVYGAVYNGGNLYSSPFVYAPVDFDYFGDGPYKQNVSENYSNFTLRFEADSIDYATSRNVYNDPASFVISIIDFGYADTTQALPSISVTSDSFYILNDDTSTYYSASSGGGWLYFVVADELGVVRDYRITLPNGAFNNTLNLGQYLDYLLVHFGDADLFKYLVQVQIKQNYFASVNVPSTVPIYEIRSTVSLGTTFLSDFQNAYVDLVNDELLNSYYSGFASGEGQGFANGYNQGYDEGYDAGFKLAEDLADDGWFGWLFNAVDSFLNTPLFSVYETEVSLGGLCGIFVGISVILWVLKLIAGG